MGGEIREEQYPTPARHLVELLERALNPFEVPDELLSVLQGTLLHRAELHSWRHRSAPPPRLRCCSYRHSFLLPNGETVLLWELCYETGEGADSSGACYEVYCDELELQGAEDRLRSPAERNPQFGPGFTDVAPRTTTGHTAGTTPEEGPEALWDVTAELASEESERRRQRAQLSAARRDGYAREGSSEHARRLLRRAENADRPGTEVLDALAEARGHRIAHVPRPLPGASARQVWCSLYEHAFLLPDDSEVRLYELEHNLSGNGELVCEVYLEEAVADSVAHRRARERGIEL